MPLGDLCFDALVSFTFNLGEGALAASTLRRLVNAGRVTEAGPQFERWVFAGACKLPGLVDRRATERVLWERGLQTNRQIFQELFCRPVPLGRKTASRLLPGRWRHGFFRDPGKTGCVRWREST